MDPTASDVATTHGSVESIASLSPPWASVTSLPRDRPHVTGVSHQTYCSPEGSWAGCGCAPAVAGRVLLVGSSKAIFGVAIDCGSNKQEMDHHLTCTVTMPMIRLDYAATGATTPRKVVP